MQKISVLVTSDIHGYVMPTDFSNGEDLPIGLGKLMSIIEEERKYNAVILIDNGDLIQGSPMMYYEQKFGKYSLNQMVLLANEMQYDAAVFGNHEFNFGLPILKSIIKQSHFPWLSANIKEENGAYFTKPYVMKEIAGLRIAIVGITTPFVSFWEDPEHIKGLVFEDALKAAKEQVGHLQEKYNVNAIIVAYHGGFEKDLATGESLELTRENIGYELCQQLDNVDVVITGHQHRELAQHLFDKAIVQPGTKGSALGKIELLFNEEGILQQTIPQLIYPDASVKVHPHSKTCIGPIYEETEKWLDQNIGEIAGDMSVQNPFEARLKGHTYVEFINRVQMEVSGAPISCTSIFNDTCTGFSKEITMRNIVTNYIYPNTLKVLLVKGNYIVKALEQSATYFTLEQGGPTVSQAFRLPKEQPYNYDMWSGIDYTIELSKPVGNRVIKVLYNGQPLQAEQSYEVVMNSYRATGAGNFDYFKECPIIKDIQTDMTELLADYFSRHDKIEARPMDNMKIIY